MNKPALITMQGPRRPGAGAFDISKMSNFEAGVATLVLINDVYPGARFSDLPNIAARVSAEPLAGWWTSLKSGLGDIKDGIGDVLKDTFSTVGGGAGDAIRLASDPKVIDAASRAGSAYATGGASEGARSMGDKIFDFISTLGSSAKSATDPGVGDTTKSILPWALAGGAVLLLVAIKK